MGEVLRTLRDAADDAVAVSFVVDEFQAAYELDEAIPAVVKRITDELHGVSLILSGSKRHLMAQLTTGRAAPLARIGTAMALPKVPRDAMVDFLSRRAASGGKLLAQPVAEAIHDAADGIPNECQQIAWFAYEAASRAAEHAGRRPPREQDQKHGESACPDHDRMMSERGCQPAPDGDSRPIRTCNNGGD